MGRMLNFLSYPGQGTGRVELHTLTLAEYVAIADRQKESFVRFVS